MLKAVLMMLVLGGLCGGLLGIASVKFHVEEDHRAEEILALLPGYNCGGCGYPGCAGMAAAIADGSGNVMNCKPSKPEQKEKIKQYLPENPAA